MKRALRTICRCIWRDSLARSKSSNLRVGNPIRPIGSSVASRRYVMHSKPGPVAKLLPSAHAIEREFRVMKALGDTAIPVPRMLVLCEDESVIGRAFYIMENVEGRVMWEQWLPDLSPGERSAIYTEMNRVIAALHSIDYAAIGLDTFGRPGNYFARQIGRWSKQYQASETEKIPAMDKLIAWLPHNIPPGEETTIVHGDYRMDNLIFHPSEPRVLAILDWELSTLGHPLADFSYHCMSWHIPPEQFSRHRPGSISRRWAFRAKPITSTCIASARGAMASRTGTSISPTTCFASPPSCKASCAAMSMASPRTHRRWMRASAPGRSPSWAGPTRKKR